MNQVVCLILLELFLVNAALPACSTTQCRGFGLIHTEVLEEYASCLLESTSTTYTNMSLAKGIGGTAAKGIAYGTPRPLRPATGASKICVVI